MDMVNTEQESTDTLLRRHTFERVHGELISSLVSSSYSVNCSATVGELSTELTDNKEIEAIGVTDDEGQALGIIVRSELFNLLGRPFGREILQKRAIGDMAKEVKTFHHERNIFSVSEELTEELKSNTEDYFLLVDGGNKFAGIFTSRDMLIYLSEISQRDMAMARNLQRRIVKEYDEVIEDRYSLAVVSSMAKGVGGDFYYKDHFGDQDHLFMAICDVSGKGAAASLVTSALWGIAGMYNFADGMSGFLKKLNAYLLHTFEGEKFVTGVFVQFNPTTGEITLCDMGHSHLYLLRDEKLRKIKTNDVNPPLGVIDPIDPVINTVALKPKDVAAFITDGLIEQTNSDGEEYPIARFAKFLVKGVTTSMKATLEAVMKDLTVFRGNQPQHDDVTLSLLQYDPGE